MESSQKNLKSLEELKGYTFVVPSYQRGYRWTKVEIIRLLNDIYEFAQGEDNAPYYPLQPIIVKKVDKVDKDQCENADRDKCYVLIDGQQRMTTLYLIIKALDRESPYAIVYETRKRSREFLENIPSRSKEDAKGNPDFHYMWKAYETIKDWLGTKNRDKITNAILSRVKVIWYEIGENENEEAVFIRLNAGKIPLTDTELIRGYILQEKNWKGKEERLRVAREWDLIQMALEDDPFWYFLAGKKADKYETRMDLLFEIMLGEKRDERYTLFSKFVEQGKEVRKMWMDIQKIYSYLRYFYENNELYHLIGFLTSIEEESYRVLNDIYSKLQGDNGKINEKIDIIGYVRNNIKDKLGLSNKNEYREVYIGKSKSERIRDLNFNDHKPSILRILLLFNILTAIDSKHYRFPFDLYHKEKWSLEHIHARNDRGLRSNKDWIVWFYRNLKVLEKLKDEQENSNTRKKDIIEKIKKVLGSLCESYIKEEKSPEKEIQEICDNKYSKKNQSPDKKDLMDEIFKFFDEYAQKRSQKSEKEIKKEYDTNDISNLALLSGKQNSALSNQTFAVKRQIIVEKDKKGEFIPPATRNAFLKYYTKEPEDFLVWHINDRAAYEDAIVERLKKFLNEILKEGSEHEQQG